MNRQRKLKKLTALTLALVLAFVLLPAIPVHASGETVTVQYLDAEFTISDVVAHFNFGATEVINHLDDRIDELPYKTTYFFVREGAVLEFVRMGWLSSRYTAGMHGNRFQFTESHLSGDFDGDSFLHVLMTLQEDSGSIPGIFDIDSYVYLTGESVTLEAGQFFIMELSHIGMQFYYEDLLMGFSSNWVFFVVDEALADLFAAEGETPPADDPISTPAPAPNLGTASSWAREGIAEAVALGIVPQALQNHYRNNITRAEFTAIAVMLYETITGTEITGRVTFNDTNDVNVEKAAYLGIITGTGGNNFSPNMPFNRQQVAVIIVRLAEALGQPLPAVTATFADNAEIASWAREQTGQVQAAGIMEGVSGGRFNPQGNFTREQSIITMLRLFDFLS